MIKYTMIMKEIEKICENYEMGFISAYEFLREYAEHLGFLGANKPLLDKMSESLAPLANHVHSIVKGGYKSGKSIEDFNK